MIMAVEVYLIIFRATHAFYWNINLKYFLVYLFSRGNNLLYWLMHKGKANVNKPRWRSSCNHRRSFPMMTLGSHKQRMRSLCSLLVNFCLSLPWRTLESSISWYTSSWIHTVAFRHTSIYQPTFWRKREKWPTLSTTQWLLYDMHKVLMWPSTCGQADKWEATYG